MKKLVLFTFVLLSGIGAKAQGIDFGLKAGVNFANINGDLNADGITSFHAGAALELNLTPGFSVQVEGLYSSQGAEYKNIEGLANDVNLDYIAAPIMAKFYIIPDRLSLMAGPQFSFLISEAEEAWDSKSFDLAAAGGIELKITEGLFAQARYTIGLNDVYDNVDSKNAVLQFSLGYYLF